MIALGIVIVWLVGIYPAIYLLARFIFDGQHHRMPGEMSDAGAATAWGFMWPAVVVAIIFYYIIEAVKWVNPARIAQRVINKHHG